MNNREAFEAWYQNEYVQFGRANFHLNSYGEYSDDDLEASWCAWQAALASQAQQPTEMKPYGYAVEEADGEVKFFSTFDRPAESYAFKVKTRKVVPLYKQPPAPEGGDK